LTMMNRIIGHSDARYQWPGVEFVRLATR